ncbi:hypothetical protein OKZ62_001904 [Vibrio navarrensis]|nr:hypothetical protein [Vibrio navarrensis]
MSEIQKALELANQVNNGKTNIPVPAMLIDAKGNPEKRKQMQDALDAINLKYGKKE